MHLELSFSGRELSDEMLKDLQQFLRDHEYEGGYEFSIRAAQARPATAERSRPQIVARPRRPQASAEAPKIEAKPHDHIRIRPRH